MRKLLIANIGEVEEEALTLLGASTKRGDSSKIGMFGSGNKYALSYLKRNGIGFEIYSGLTKIYIGTSKVSLRGNEFEVFTVNGKQTSITTEFGKDWKLWEALRELYSNAIDEGLTEFKMVDETAPEDGKTHIYIDEGQALKDFMLDFDLYFTRYRKPIYESEHGAIYQKLGKKANIYRKGIKVLETEKSSVYDYDLPSIRIDENRRASYTWEITEQLWRLLMTCNDSSIIRRAITDSGDGSVIEHEISSSIVTIPHSYMEDNKSVWEEAIGEKLLAPVSLSPFLEEEDKLKTIFIPAGLWGIISTVFKEKYTPRGLKFGSKGTYRLVAQGRTSTIHNITLDKVITFFRECNFKIPYDIKIAEFSDAQVYGTIDEETQSIILGTEALDRGADQVATVIIEELIHLKSGAQDKTRAFQEASINLLINYMKENNAILL